ncbi:hypothetical protein [Hyperthermus butylicus]|uniref:hypothetical protein n=1 Tax=Hyperthermus butylicus TaxID=54248 RepID=UPI00129B45CC|nr:hypothetical protein [Hyperthermus butylicus]
MDVGVIAAIEEASASNSSPIPAASILLVSFNKFHPASQLHLCGFSLWGLGRLREEKPRGNHGVISPCVEDIAL